VAPASFHDFFSASAAVAGALIGLLFVAISVTPGQVTGDTASAEHQVTAGVYAIARSWQLVGARDPSLLPTVAALAARRLQHPEPAGARPAAAPRDESAGGRDGPAREGG
jgi:hypothetical protein